MLPGVDSTVMAEEREPDLDHVRRAMREHDERQEDEVQPVDAEAEPDEAEAEPDEDEGDEEA